MRSCKVCNAETHPTFLSLVPKAAFWELSPATLPEGLPPACTGPGAAMVGSGSSSPNMASYTMDYSRNPIWDWLCFIPQAVCLQGFLRLRAALIEGPYQCGFSGDPSLQLVQTFRRLERFRKFPSTGSLCRDPEFYRDLMRSHEFVANIFVIFVHWHRSSEVTSPPALSGVPCLNDLFMCSL